MPAARRTAGMDLPRFWRGWQGRVTSDDGCFYETFICINMNIQACSRPSS